MFERGLDVPHILQINATVIAGVLILMTVSSFSEPIPSLTTEEHGIRTVNQWISFTILPFVFSSLFAIWISYGGISARTLSIFGTLTYGGMIGGFFYLIILVWIISTSY